MDCGRRDPWTEKKEEEWRGEGVKRRGGKKVQNYSEVAKEDMENEKKEGKVMKEKKSWL